MEDIVFLDNPSQEDWEQCVNLCYNHDQWALAYNDWPTWKLGFPDGVNVYYAKRKTTNEVVGFCTFSTMKSLDRTDDISNLGCYFVHPAFRSLGIGSALFKAAMKTKTEEQKNITIVSGSMREKYDRHHGFNKYLGFKYESYLIPMEVLDEKVLESESDAFLANLKQENVEIVDFCKASTQGIADFDAQIVKFDRKAFVPAWIGRSDSLSKVAIDAKTGKVVGYASIRTGCGKQLMFSPIFADSEEIAFGLTFATILGVSDLKSYKSLFFSSPSSNNGILKLIRKLSNDTFQVLDSVVRQFTQHVPEIDENKIFALTVYGLVFV